MTQEDKKLLLKDLTTRLLYGAKGIITYDKSNTTFTVEGIDNNVLHLSDAEECYVEDFKPYLRPMPSMTEEEKKEFSKLLVKRYCEEDWEGHISTSYCIEIDNVYTDDEDGIKYPSAFSIDAIDWLNAHHFDYRGLIPMGLALEAPIGMYN